MKQILLLTLSILVLFSCSVTHKLTTAKTLRIIDRSTYSVDTLGYPVYMFYASFATYKSDFLGELKSAFGENNVSIVDSGTAITDYTFIISKIIYKETIEIETISDTASPNYGQTFPLRVCSITSEGTLYNSRAEKVDDFSVKNYSSESTSNQRTFWDYVFHQNKDYHSYHSKTLTSGIFEYIAKGNGKSTSKNVTNKIYEIEKKAKSF